MLPARLLLSLVSSVVSEHVNPGAFSPDAPPHSSALHVLAKRDNDSTEFIVFACLIPVLVILSGIFAGLTLGYMSLDETQLNVLSISGTPKQKEYANKIKPIRKNGHLLLVTLLLANMITNETLPVISAPVLGGGVQSVVVSTVLIVFFAEIIPQSVCTRYGLYIGAKMAGPTQILIYVLGIVAWPVAKLLEFTLGPHHGIIYRRAELKELIAMHSDAGVHGGDLRSDTVTIIGATLDLQEKVVTQAMTPIDKVFMLSIDAKLDYDTLRRICLTGHSRVPVYEEVEVNQSLVPSTSSDVKSRKSGADVSDKVKVKKIIGILLVKQCVLLDPEDAIPVRKIRLNKVLFVPQNEPLLGMLDRFQEGRSHIAIVSRISVDKAASVKQAVKKGLTRRLRETVMGDSSSSTSESSSDNESDDEGHHVLKWGKKKSGRKSGSSSTLQKDEGSHGEPHVNTAAVDESNRSHEERKRAHFKDHKHGFSYRGRKKKKAHAGADKADIDDLEMGDIETEVERQRNNKPLPSPATLVKASALEQSMPADAVLTKEAAKEYIRIQGIDPAIMPVGIITLEDVLEELIGEEIYDEFDPEGAHSQYYVPPGAQVSNNLTVGKTLIKKSSAPELATSTPKILGPAKKSSNLFGSGSGDSTSTPNGGTLTGGGMKGLVMPRPIAIPTLKTLGFLRSRSAPPTPREQTPVSKPLTSQEGGDEKDRSANASVAPTISTDEAGVTIVVPESQANRSAVPTPTLSVTSTDREARLLGQIPESPSLLSSPSDEAVAQNQNDVTSDNNDNASNAQSVVTVPAPVSTTNLTAGSAPPLEAILLERKRRAHMQTLGVASSMSLSNSEGPPAAMIMGTRIKAGSPMVKGKGFKSSPLSGASSAEEARRQKREERLSISGGGDAGERTTFAPGSASSDTKGVE